MRFFILLVALALANHAFAMSVPGFGALGDFGMPGIPTTPSNPRADAPTSPPPSPPPQAEGTQPRGMGRETDQVDTPPVPDVDDAQIDSPTVPDSGDSPMSGNMFAGIMKGFNI